MFRSDLALMSCGAKCSPTLSRDLETRFSKRFRLSLHNDCILTASSMLIARVVECRYRKHLPMFRSDSALMSCGAKCSPTLSRDLETRFSKRFRVSLHNDCILTASSMLIARVVECRYRKHLPMIRSDLALMSCGAKCSPTLSRDLETRFSKRFRVSLHNDCILTASSMLIARVVE